MLNDLRLYPRPKVQYRNGRAKDQISQFTQRHFAVNSRLGDRIYKEGYRNNGQYAKHNSECLHMIQYIQNPRLQKIKSIAKILTYLSGHALQFSVKIASPTQHL